MTPHSNAYIRAWLTECGPASSGDYNRLHGLTGRQAERIGQRMSGMYKDGLLTRMGQGGPGKPYVYGIARVAMDRFQSAACAAAGRVRAAEARRAAMPRVTKPKPERLPRIPKPKPFDMAKVRVKPSRRIKEDGAFTVAAVKAPPVDKSLPDTEAFIAANPERFERLPSFLDRRAA